MRIKMQKKCSKCGVEKSLDSFPKRKNSSDGYYSYCRDCKNSSARKRYKEDAVAREKIKAKQKEWYEANRDYSSYYHKEYRKKNAELVKNRKRKYYRDNKEEIMHKSKKYMQEKRKSDPLFKLKGNIQSLIKMALIKNGAVKSLRTKQILGCDFAELFAHLERQFLPGMSWDNRGEWHIDHIIRPPQHASSTFLFIIGFLTKESQFLRPWKGYLLPIAA